MACPRQLRSNNSENVKRPFIFLFDLKAVSAGGLGNWTICEMQAQSWWISEGNDCQPLLYFIIGSVLNTYAGGRPLRYLSKSFLEIHTI